MPVDELDSLIAAFDARQKPDPELDALLSAHDQRYGGNTAPTAPLPAPDPQDDIVRVIAVGRGEAGPQEISDAELAAYEARRAVEQGPVTAFLPPPSSPGPGPVAVPVPPRTPLIDERGFPVGFENWSERDRQKYLTDPALRVDAGGVPIGDLGVPLGWENWSEEDRRQYAAEKAGLGPKPMPGGVGTGINSIDLAAAANLGVPPEVLNATPPAPPAEPPYGFMDVLEANRRAVRDSAIRGALGVGRAVNEAIGLEDPAKRTQLPIEKELDRRAAEYADAASAPGALNDVARAIPGMAKMAAMAPLGVAGFALASGSERLGNVYQDEIDNGASVGEAWSAAAKKGAVDAAVAGVTMKVLAGFGDLPILGKIAPKVKNAVRDAAPSALERLTRQGISATAETVTITLSGLAQEAADMAIDQSRGKKVDWSTLAEKPWDRIWNSGLMVAGFKAAQIPGMLRDLPQAARELTTSGPLAPGVRERRPTGGRAAGIELNPATNASLTNPEIVAPRARMADQIAAENASTATSYRPQPAVDTSAMTVRELVDMGVELGLAKSPNTLRAFSANRLRGMVDEAMASGYNARDVHTQTAAGGLENTRAASAAQNAGGEGSPPAGPREGGRRVGRKVQGVLRPQGRGGAPAAVPGSTESATSSRLADADATAAAELAQLKRRGLARSKRAKELQKQLADHQSEDTAKMGFAQPERVMEPGEAVVNAFGMGEAKYSLGERPQGGTHGSLPDLISAATRRKKGNDLWHEYALVKPQEAEKIKAVTGLDTTGYIHQVDESAVRHILNEHGEGKERDISQVPVTPEDIANIPNLIRTADGMEPGVTRHGLKAIIYCKRANGFTYYVEEARTKRSKLSAVTMWKKKSGPAKDSSVALTSETFRAQSQAPLAVESNVASAESSIPPKTSEASRPRDVAGQQTLFHTALDRPAVRATRITADDLRAMPGVKRVRETQDGRSVIMMHNGLMATFGHDLPAEIGGRPVLGQFMTIQDRSGMKVGRIDLADLAGRETWDHETVHWAKTFSLFTDAEWSALKRRFARKEVRETGIEEAIARGLSKSPDPAHRTIWERVKDFFARMYNYSLGRALGRAIARGAVADWQRGGMWKRKPENRGDGETRYAVGSKPPADPYAFVKTRDGLDDFGEITPEWAKTRGIVPGKIRLQVGKHDPISDWGYGKVHIEARHAQEFRQAGYATVERFIEHTLDQARRVVQTPDRRIVVTSANRFGKLVALELRPEHGGFYSVISAYPTGKTMKQVKGRLLWEQAGAASSGPGTTSPLTLSLTAKNQAADSIRRMRVQSKRPSENNSNPNSGSVKYHLAPSSESTDREAVNLDQLDQAIRRGFSVKGFLKRYFTGAGDLPPDAFSAKLQKDADIQAGLRRIVYTTREFNRAAKTIRLTPEQRELAGLVLKGEGDPAKLPKAVLPVLARMRAEVDSLSRQLIETGSVEGELAVTVDKNMGHYLTRSYRVFRDPDWAQAVPVEVRNRAKAWLRSEYPDLSPAEIEGKIQNLLFEGKAADSPMAVIAGSKLGAKDIGVLLKRKDIPKPLRELWGEDTDPLTLYTNSAAKMTHLLANQKFLDTVRESGLVRWLHEEPIVNQDGNFSVRLAADGSEAMAPLNGLYTTPAIRDAFQEFGRASRGQGMAAALGRAYLKANSLTKGAATVFNLAGTIRNFLSNGLFAGSAGHWNWLRLGHAAKVVNADLRGGNAALQAEHNKLVELGVLRTDINAGQLRDLLADADAATGTPRSKIGQAGKAVAETAADIYNAMDELWKINGFYNERAMLARAMPKADAATLDRMAADAVVELYPSYNRVSRGVKEVRKVPLTGMFLTFPAEVIRTTKNLLTRTARELADPQLRGIGAKRLVGLLTSTTLPHALSMLSRYLWGVTDDEDKAVRKLGPIWNRNSVLLYFGKDDKGNYRYVDLSYVDPYTVIRKPIMAFLNGQDWETSLTNAASEAASPVLGEQALSGALLDIARNKTQDGRAVWQTYDTPTDKAKKITEHVGQPFAPGTARSVYRLVQGLRGTVSDRGRVYDPKIEALAMLTGQRIIKLDPAQSLKFAAIRFAREYGDTLAPFRSTFQRSGTVGDDELRSSYANLDANRRGLFEEISAQYRAAITLGVNPRDAGDILMNSGISTADAKAIVTRAYLPYFPSSRFGEEAVERVGKESAEGRELDRRRDVLQQEWEKYEAKGR